MAPMRPLLLCAALALAGCGGLANSVVNPMNWFGKSRSQPVGAETPTNPLIPARGFARRPIAEYAGRPVDQITALRIERRPGGALLVATGVTDVLGYYDAKLEPENDGKPVKGVLSYRFVAVRPERPLGVGGAAARTLKAGYSLTEQELRGVKSVVVKGARNQRVTRRR